MDKIVCLGKNYREHALEMGGPVGEKPVLFLKPPSVALWSPGVGATVRVPVPAGRGAVHHECEIVLRIGRDGRGLSADRAREVVDAVTLGLDMTLRDLQAELRAKGHPWEVSKVFPGAAVVGPWIEGEERLTQLDAEFEFRLDGMVKQRGRASEMTLDWARSVAHASAFFPLCAGDLVFTGTPAGVGPVAAGQTGELVWGGRTLMRVAFVTGTDAGSGESKPD